jgi:hypothetical protein
MRRYPLPLRGRNGALLEPVGKLQRRSGHIGHL